MMKKKCLKFKVSKLPKIKVFCLFMSITGEIDPPAAEILDESDHFYKRIMVNQQRINGNCTNGKEVVGCSCLTGCFSMGLSLQLVWRLLQPIVTP
jgi:hypothetical protein